MLDILEPCTDEVIFKAEVRRISNFNDSVSSVTNSENKGCEEEILGDGRIKRSRAGRGGGGC
jgi:hypothetical protein